MARGIPAKTKMVFSFANSTVNFVSYIFVYLAIEFMVVGAPSNLFQPYFPKDKLLIFLLKCFTS